jgi:hypothetical protein
MFGDAAPKSLHLSHFAPLGGRASERPEVP